MTRLDVPSFSLLGLNVSSSATIVVGRDYQTLYVPAVASLLSFSLFFFPLDYAKQAYIFPLKWGEARHSSAASGTACQNKQIKKRQGSRGGQQNGRRGRGQLMPQMLIL